MGRAGRSGAPAVPPARAATSCAWGSGEPVLWVLLLPGAAMAPLLVLGALGSAQLSHSCWRNALAVQQECSDEGRCVRSDQVPLELWSDF